MARIKNPSVAPQQASETHTQSLPPKKQEEPFKTGIYIAIFTFERDNI